jgi:hypothetical protein
MHNTYCVEQLPADRKRVGSKWLYKFKEDGKGNIRFRTRCMGVTASALGRAGLTSVPVSYFSTANLDRSATHDN